MKYFMVLALFAAAAVAAPADKDATIVSYENDNIGVDGYKFSYQTSDGKQQQETAVLKNVGTENEAIEARGSFSYVGPDGVTYAITYIANEGGFQPQGAHLPQV